MSSSASSSSTSDGNQLVQEVFWEKMWTKDGILQPGQAFDMGRCSPVLTNLLKQREQTCKSKDMHALVPGCGRGYDVFEFARFGYTALGIDLSTTAVHEATKLKDEISAKEKLPGDASFSLQNFYELQPPKEGFDIIWDYTFLCAMPPEFREKWAKNMRRLIAPDGELVTLIYPLGDYEGGPPYAMSRELVSSLLEPQGFESTYMEPVTGGLSHPSREGKEVLARWKVKN